MAKAVETFDLLGVRVSALNVPLAVRLITEMVRQKRREYVCVAPVATIVDARRDPEYCTVINRAALVTPDGIPVVWMGRRKGCAGIERTYGPDLMLALCDAGRANGLRHFFYGGTRDVCDKLVSSLEARFPGMIVAGAVAPPYYKTAQKIGEEDLRIIRQAGPDILWVGLGSPKQDFWMALNRSDLDVPVLIGIGAAFDFIAGIKPQAPRWMQRSGLEWLFRLGCEPQRLWKRYLVGNALFIWWILTEGIKRGRE